MIREQTTVDITWKIPSRRTRPPQWSGLDDRVALGKTNQQGRLTNPRDNAVLLNSVHLVDDPPFEVKDIEENEAQINENTSLISKIRQLRPRTLHVSIVANVLFSVATLILPGLIGSGVFYVR
jgi:hypothetical protein